MFKKDSLTEQERSLAWSAGWHPSFVGRAIINADHTFRSVNAQFCEILKVTPAELIQKNFADLTPEPVKSLDIKNSELVKKGIITSYLLPKCYEFSDGRRVNALKLINGVYHPETGEFLFFVCSIMENPEDTFVQHRSQKPTELSDFELKRKSAKTGLITAIGVALGALIKYLLK